MNVSDWWYIDTRARSFSGERLLLGMGFLEALDLRDKEEVEVGALLEDALWL